MKARVRLVGTCFDAEGVSLFCFQELVMETGSALRYSIFDWYMLQISRGQQIFGARSCQPGILDELEG